MDAPRRRCRSRPAETPRESVSFREAKQSILWQPPRRQSAWPTDPRIAGAPLPADVLVAMFAEIDFGTHEPRQACKT
jgi:hypothetical protein